MLGARFYVNPVESHTCNFTFSDTVLADHSTLGVYRSLTNQDSGTLNPQAL